MPPIQLEDVVYLALGAGVFIFWLRETRRGPSDALPFWPGTTTCGWQPMLLAAAGALVLTLVESVLEIQLGVSQEQTRIPASFLLAMMGAAIVEEITFRGFAAPESLAGVRLLATVLAGSLVFMLLHGHVVKFAEGSVGLNTDAKALVSGGSAFAISCWLYLCRFNPLNPTRSLAPSLVGHTVRNLAVFGIKDVQGFVTWN